MRTDHLAALITALVLAGCASAPQVREVATGPAPQAATHACTPTPGGDQADCTLPADVRGFLEDRTLCDHFRGEPWPESESDDDRARRRQLVEGVRTNCGGTDRRLAELRERYRADARVIARLTGFEDAIED